MAESAAFCNDSLQTRPNSAGLRFNLFNHTRIICAILSIVAAGRRLSCLLRPNQGACTHLSGQPLTTEMVLGESRCLHVPSRADGSLRLVGVRAIVTEPGPPRFVMEADSRLRLPLSRRG